MLPLYILPIGFAAPIAVVATQARERRLFTLVTLLLTLAAVWMTTDASAWLWTSSEILLGKLRFPWRWQVFVAFGAALLVAACMEPLCRIRRLPAFTMPLLGVALSAYLIAFPLVNLDYPTGVDSSYREISPSALGQWGLDFLPIWAFEEFEEFGVNGRAPSSSTPNLDAIDSVAVVPTRAGLLQQQFQVTASHSFRLLFHQFYVPAWRVTIDGVQVATQTATNLALTGVTVPPGTHTVELAWHATRAVWLCRVLTAIGWVVVFAMLRQVVKGSGPLRRGRDTESNAASATAPESWLLGLRGLVRSFRLSAQGPLRLKSREVTPPDPPADRWNWPLVVWLAGGALMVVAASGITTRTRDLAATGADYGDIRLEGVLPPPPTRAGDVATVQLTWFVKDYGELVSAFVHLVDEAGAAISQHDLPPSGQYYTPYPLWTPGLLLHSEHNIPIPASLRPGRYRLLAGLYRLDASNESLVPKNADSSRLEIGMLEVLP